MHSSLGLENRCIIHPYVPAAENSNYCAFCQARARGYTRAHTQRKKTVPACGGDHDLLPGSYQCPMCGWWVLPRGRLGVYEKE